MYFFITTSDQKHVWIVFMLEAWVAKISWETLKMLYASRKKQEPTKLRKGWGEVILEDNRLCRIHTEHWVLHCSLERFNCTLNSEFMTLTNPPPCLCVVSSHFADTSQFAFKWKGGCVGRYGRVPSVAPATPRSDLSLQLGKAKSKKYFEANYWATHHRCFFCLIKDINSCALAAYKTELCFYCGVRCLVIWVCSYWSQKKITQLIQFCQI